MKIYICLMHEDKIPYMVFTSKTKALNCKMDILEKEVDFQLEIACHDVHVVMEDKEYHVFQELHQAIDYSYTKEIREFYICAFDADEFQDVDIFAMDYLFQQPFQYISKLELDYRVYNKLDAREAYKEALQMYKIFEENKMKTLLELVANYPKRYLGMVKEIEKQHQALMTGSFQTREEMVNRLYGAK